VPWPRPGPPSNPHAFPHPEAIGVALEEPFSILALENICDGLSRGIAIMTQMDGPAYEAAAAAAAAAGAAGGHVGADGGRAAALLSAEDEDEEDEDEGEAFPLVAQPVPKVQRPAPPAVGIVSGR
jgi:hypothetical protein